MESVTCTAAALLVVTGEALIHRCVLQDASRFGESTWVQEAVALWHRYEQPGGTPTRGGTLRPAMPERTVMETPGV